MPSKSFRGMMTTDAGGDSTDMIPLSTNNGAIGYQITKLQIIPKDPTDVSNEAVFQIFSIPTDSTDEIDFSNSTLLGCAHYSNHSSGTLYAEDSTIIFDNMKFNQDVYLTCKTDVGSKSINYYIEMEQLKLALDENTVATLKDIRNIKSNS